MKLHSVGGRFDDVGRRRHSRPTAPGGADRIHRLPRSASRLTTRS